MKLKMEIGDQVCLNRGIYKIASPNSKLIKNLKSYEHYEQHYKKSYYIAATLVSGNNKITERIENFEIPCSLCKSENDTISISGRIVYYLSRKNDKYTSIEDYDIKNTQHYAKILYSDNKTYMYLPLCLLEHAVY